MAQSILLFLFLCFGAGVAAQGKIMVRISNFKNSNGVCRVCLFDNAAAYNGDGNPVQCLTTGISNKNAVAIFESVPIGTYAISVFHDANKNNKLDVNFVGIPKEGYGASKNKLPFAAAPSFKENQFTLQQGAALNLPIKLRNL